MLDVMEVPSCAGGSFLPLQTCLSPWVGRGRPSPSSLGPEAPGKDSRAGICISLFAGTEWAGVDHGACLPSLQAPKATFF